MDGKTIAHKLVGDDEERAVSPVIGVILMVAITVILAAVIAAFVLDLGNTSAPVQANLDVDQDSITVTNADNINGIEVTNSGSGCNDGTIEGITLEVGASVDHGCDEGSELTIVGTNDDGGEEIIYNGVPDA